LIESESKLELELEPAGDEHGSEWFRSDRFHHILKSIQMSDHAGLLNHHKASFSSELSQSQQKNKTTTTSKKVKTKVKKTATGGRFNSSEFSIEIPPTILQAASSIVQVCCKKQEKEKELKKKLLKN
jgi:hypothetical protein